jgi:sarcosine oxidase, subunit alpha
VPGEPAQRALGGRLQRAFGALALRAEARAAGEGRRAGPARVRDRNRPPRRSARRRRGDSHKAWRVPLVAATCAAVKAFVDFQNDVTAKDIARGARGLPLDRARQALHHHRHGDRPGQDVEHERARHRRRRSGKPIPEVGLTTFRMPYTPVTFGTLRRRIAGALFDPTRKTPIHEWAEAQGAVFEDVGQWKRARYFPRAGEDMHAAVARECRTVRARSACSTPRRSARSRSSGRTRRSS